MVCCSVTSCLPPKPQIKQNLQVGLKPDYFEKILVQCEKRITVFQTQLALGYSVLSHRQLVPRAAVARPSGGLEGESPSSDCRRLVCSSMLLLCRGALSREKTGKEPTNISCSNYTILYRQTLLKLRKILAQKNVTL